MGRGPAEAKARRLGLSMLCSGFNRDGEPPGPGSQDVWFHLGSSGFGA